MGEAVEVLTTVPSDLWEFLAWAVTKAGLGVVTSVVVAVVLWIFSVQSEKAKKVIAVATPVVVVVAVYAIQVAVGAIAATPETLFRYLYVAGELIITSQLGFNFVVKPIMERTGLKQQ